MKTQAELITMQAQQAKSDAMNRELKKTRAEISALEDSNAILTVISVWLGTSLIFILVTGCFMFYSHEQSHINQCSSTQTTPTSLNIVPMKPRARV
jgi:two-component sensor histidine kinase